jgi:hypothetical protein
VRPPRRIVTIEPPPVLNRLSLDAWGRLSVDGRELPDLVRAAERAAGDAPGEYLWLPGSSARLPSRHLFGEPETGSPWDQDWGSYGYDPDSVALGGCRCGVVGCDPLVVVIELGDELIRWRTFASRVANPLDLGPFVFGAAQYRAALAEV